IRDAAHAGRHDDVTRAQLTRRSIPFHFHLPLLRDRVVRAALEFRAGPVVELQALDVGLEPAGELVLRDVHREARREGQVGQMVDVHLVVQRQRVIALAPVVAGARPAVDDQGVDLALAEARRNRKACLPAAEPAVLVVGGGQAGLSIAARLLRRSSQFGPPKSREYDHPFGRRRPVCSSRPLSSSSAVRSVQARSSLMRSTPAPAPSAVSKRKMASMHSSPARVTARGAVRSGSMRKPWALAPCSAATSASRPLVVRIRQVRARTSRQWLSAWNSPRSAAASCRARALSNFANQWLTLVASWKSVMAS